MGGCASGKHTEAYDGTTTSTSTYTVHITSDPFFADEGYNFYVFLSGSNYKIQFTDCARQQLYTGAPGSWPCAGDGLDAPDPNILGSTYWGVKTGIPSQLNSTPFDVWQSLDKEKIVFRSNWNSMFSSYGSSGIFLTGQGLDINEVIVDSQNCVWAISQTSTNNHAKIYPSNAISNNTVFPSGGLCRWPVSGTDIWTYGNNFSDPYVEYVLTRDASDTLWAQVSAATPNSSNQKNLARQWAALSGGNVIGRRVYPNYGAGIQDPGGWTHTISRDIVSDSFHPNSDESGISFILTQGEYFSRSTYIHPDYVEPIIDLVVNVQNTSPVINDGQFWNNQAQSSTTGASGYDDLTTTMLVSVIDTGSFDLVNFNFKYGDKNHDICGDGSCNCSTDVTLYPQCGPNPETYKELYNEYSSSPLTTYKYHDPSKSGKPGSRWNGAPGTSDGTYSINATAFAFVNPYVISGTDINAGLPQYKITSDKTIVVYERWPTAKFYISINNLPCILTNWFNTTLWRRDDHSEDLPTDNGLPLTDENRIVSGIAPLSASFNDISIGRTWPISSWHFDFKSDETSYSTYFYIISNCAYGVYPIPSQMRSDNTIVYTTSTATITTTDPTFHQRDSASVVHGNLAEHVFFKPGIYDVTLYVQASCTGTESAAISSGIIDEHILSGFIPYTTRRIIAVEACPWANFLTVSAGTVSANYHDEYGSFVAQPTVPAYISTDGYLISGYAPNLTIMWQDSSVARSYPLCAYEWNFGDYYNELYLTSSVYVSVLNTGYPTWFSDKTNHKVTHTYVMPGIYNVTLDVVVSGTGTHSCEPCAKNLHVYVEEINPQACYTFSLNQTSGYTSDVILNEISPITIYFNPSCVVPGSFPICRLDWDFGDGSEITTVTRYPSSNIVNLTAFPNDLSDPRNIIVDHIYQRNSLSDQSSFIVTLTAYACNTSTTSIISAYILSGLNIPTDETITNDENRDKPLHLIKNRIFDTNNMLVFEGQKNYTMNYILSTGS